MILITKTAIIGIDVTIAKAHSLLDVKNLETRTAERRDANIACPQGRDIAPVKGTASRSDERCNRNHPKG